MFMFPTITAAAGGDYRRSQQRLPREEHVLAIREILHGIEDPRTDHGDFESVVDDNEEASTTVENAAAAADDLMGLPLAPRNQHMNNNGRFYRSQKQESAKLLSSSSSSSSSSSTYVTLSSSPSFCFGSAKSAPRKCLRWWWLPVLATIAILGIVFLSIGLSPSSRHGDGQQELNETDVTAAGRNYNNGTNLPFPLDPEGNGVSMTEAVQMQRYNSLLLKIMEWNVTNMTDLVSSNEASPAYQALKWLAFSDETTEISATDTGSDVNVRTRFALATFYFSTYRNASAWNSSHLWLSTQHSVCFWYGIYCVGDSESNHFENSTPPDDGEERVEAIYLGSNKLVGTIPRELSLLYEDLEILDLSGNSLYGSIPDEMGEFVNLRELYLGPNRFSYTIPDSIFNLTLLTHLYLDSCQLSGSLSERNIARLVNLEALSIQDNYLTGTIPRSIGQLAQLVVLNLDINAIGNTIPTSLGNLTKLVYLRLSSNCLVGSIPSELSNLHHLQVLSLSDNQLTGLLDKALDFTAMPLLVYLLLSTNQFNGTIPQGLGFLPLLQVLDLSDNDVGGVIPASLGNDFFLESLYLNNNNLSGSIPTTVGNLHNLIDFRVDNNRLENTIPTELGYLSNLQTLFLNNNSLVGEMPKQLGQLSQLSRAYFHGNSLKGDFSLCHLDELTADCKRRGIECPCCSFCYY